MRDFIDKSAHRLPPSDLFRSSCTQRRAAYADSLYKQWFHFGEITAFLLKPPLRQRRDMSNPSSRSGFSSGAARVSHGTAALMPPTSQRKPSNGGLCRKRRAVRHRMIQKQAQRARVCARPPFSVFCLHLFTFVG